MKKHFNKNLIMNEEEEYLFQQSNNCWICKKLIDNDDEKVRDHCHVTGKFRGSAHCNKIILTFSMQMGLQQAFEVYFPVKIYINFFAVNLQLFT